MSGYVSLLLVFLFTSKIPGQAKSRTPCPERCKCTERNCIRGEKDEDDDNCIKVTKASKTSTDVIVRRRWNLPMNSTKLMQDVEQYLSDRQLSTYLTLNNIPLHRVPSSVCGMTSLERLVFYKVGLSELPKNCFTKMKHLKWFSAERNDLNRIEDGIFAGLQNLLELRLCCNKISYLGIKDLQNEADLLSLRLVDLADNELVELDTWPFVRALVIKNKNTTFVANLRLNTIKYFKNTRAINFNYYNKSLKGVKLDIFLGTNFMHPIDIVNDWGFASAFDFIALISLHQWNRNTYITIDWSEYYCEWRDNLFIESLRNNEYFLQISQDDINLINCGKNKDLRYTPPLIRLSCNVTEDCPRECECLQRPANSTFHVHCRMRQLLVPPMTVPFSDGSRYKLDFSHNTGLRLEPRDYFLNASILDVSYCNLVAVTDATWQALANIETVFLHDNQLTSLPNSATKIRFAVQELTLCNNKWSCSCDNSQLKDQLQFIQSSLRRSDEIFCNTPVRLHGKVILRLTNDEFCIDPAMKVLAITLSSVGACLLLLTIVCVSLYRCRVKIHSTWNIHPFDRDECDGEHMEYDVFICCAIDASRFAREILNFLENESYKGCYHLRDFMPGALIDDNICQAITTSKRTLCILSSDFIRSPYCMREFELASHRNSILGKKRLIMAVLQFPDLGGEGISASLKQYVSSHTYLDCSAKNFRKALLYAMPVSRLGLNSLHDPQPQNINIFSDENAENDRIGNVQGAL